MDGVIVLKTFETRIGYAHGPTWLGITFLIIAISIFLYGVIAGVLKQDYDCIGLSFLISLVFLLITLIPWGASTPIYETRQQVYITEQIDMNEFYQHYEIVEQDGVTLIVREKGES